MSRRERPRPAAAPPRAPRAARAPLALFAGPATDALRSPWVALAVALILAPTLARTPQNGDGAELVMTALRGGVLHPPGFPLQAWCDRALAAIAPAHVALLISALGLAAHASAAGFVAATLRRLGVSWSARVLATLAYACYPAIWAVSVQPETFALGHAFVAAAVYVAVRAATSPCTASVREAYVVGVLASLGLASHPLVITAAPAYLVAAAWVLRGAPGRATRALVLLGATVLPALALYLSLPLLRGNAVWPDWGALRTAGDVMRHALRADYGGAALAAGSAGSGASGASQWALTVWASDAWAHWKYLLVVCAFGLPALAWPGRVRAAVLPVLGTLLAGLLLLSRGRLPVQSYSAEVLGQLQGPVTIALALLMGLGWHWATSHARHPLSARIFAALALVAALGLPVAGWTIADASRDRTLELYTRGIALELPADAVYVTGGDVESLFGVPSASGRPGAGAAAGAAAERRFPIAQQQMMLERYVTEVAPKLEPRVFGAGGVTTWGAMMMACAAQGLSVAGSSPELLAAPNSTPELRGLTYVAAPNSTDELTVASVAAAVRLAPLAAELPSLPPQGHAFSRFHQRRFARGFAGAAELLRHLGNTELADQADAIAQEIVTDVPVIVRGPHILAFADSARAAGY